MLPVDRRPSSLIRISLMVSSCVHGNESPLSVSMLHDALLDALVPTAAL
jgi:hypothetical protein